MRRWLILLAGLVCSWSCATTHRLDGRCLVEDEDIARAIGAAVLRTADPMGPNFHIQDFGRRWLVGEWVDDLDTDDEVLLGFGGISVEIDKCSGELSNLRSWR